MERMILLPQVNIPPLATVREHQALLVLQGIMDFTVLIMERLTHLSQVHQAHMTAMSQTLGMWDQAPLGISHEYSACEILLDLMGKK